VDTKKQIEAALSEIGKDRNWLAEASGYSYFSVRDCLAPKGKNLSKRMFGKFMEVIARHKAEDSPTPEPYLPDRITLLCTPEQRDNYEKAAQKAELTSSAWAVSELDKAADVWATHKLHSVKAAKKA